MSRPVPEWIGKPGADVPQRVRLRVFSAKGGRCWKCKRKIGPADKWTCEHMIAEINAAPGVNVNRESNLGVTCAWCLPEKNNADLAEKSKVAAIRAKHLGIKKASGFQTNRSGKFKKHMDGRVTLR